MVSSGVDEANATDAVARITGGRFVLLNAYVTNHRRGVTNDQVLANYKRAPKSALKRIQVSVTDDDVFRAVSTGSLFEGDDTVDVDELSKLTRENVLTVNATTRLVTFNARHVQTVFTETESAQRRRE